MEKYKERKITKDKLNYEIDWEFITLLAERMQKGKEKYEPYSWQKHTEIEGLKQALLRHTLEIMKDNYLDDGQRYGHIAAATANLMMIHFQLKSTDNIKISPKTHAIVFDLSVRDLELWLKNTYTTLLILYDAKIKKAFYID